MKKTCFVFYVLMLVFPFYNRVFSQNMKDKVESQLKQQFKEVEYVNAGFLVSTYDGKWGYYGYYETVISPDKYTKIEPVTSNNAYGLPFYYYVYVGDQVGLCDDEGKEFVAVGRYSKIGQKTKGKFPVWKGDKAGIIDSKGNELVAPQKYSDVQVLSSNRFAVYLDKFVGICDDEGGEIIKPNKYSKIQYDEIVDYYVVFVGDKAGLCDANGKEMLSPQNYTEIGYVKEFEKYWVKNADKTGVLDKDLKEIVPVSYSKVLYDKKNDYFEVYRDGQVGIVKNSKEIIAPIKYSRIVYDSKSRYYKVYIGDKVGVCLSSGKEIIAPLYTGIIECVEDERLFVLKNGDKCGAIDFEGKTIVNVEYQEVSFCGEHVLSAKKDGKYGCFSALDGKILLAFEYDNIGAFKDGVAQVVKNGKKEMIPNPLKAVAQNTNQPKVKGKAVSTFPAPDSDVDKDIPMGKSIDDNAYAFIIANENYPVAKVPYALNDGWVFEQYCKKTLGIKEENVHLYEDATGGNILACVEEMKQTANAASGKATIVFYYAGHAFPDEEKSTAYLLPVDGDSKNPATGYSLEKFYKEMNSVQAKQVVCFIDACFSGATRDDQMLIAGRGVAIKVKDEIPQGNMVVMTSATGAETAHSFEEMHHGLFTYYLLQKLQETQGDVTLGDLSDYVNKMVKRKSVVINKKKQTPTVIPSPQLQATWKEMKL